MADYKNSNYLKHNTHAAFDGTHHAGAVAPFSGIYRCVVCSHEAVSTKGNRLPPQDHHIHANRVTPIAWQLIVASSHP